MISHLNRLKLYSFSRLCESAVRGGGRRLLDGWTSCCLTSSSSQLIRPLSSFNNRRLTHSCDKTPTAEKLLGVPVSDQRGFCIVPKRDDYDDDYGTGDQYWPNLLFTDDTWSEVDDNGDERFNMLADTAWSSVDLEETKISNLSSLRLLFSHPYRGNTVKVIMEELDLSRGQAEVYLNYLRIKPMFVKVDELKFIMERRNLLRLLKKHLSKDDIIDTFELFSLQLRISQYRISFFKECGFKHLKPVHLLHFDKIKALSEQTLKHMRLLDSDISVTDYLLSQLSNLSDHEISHLRDKLNSQGLTLGKQYEIVISYLSEKAKDLSQICKSKSHSRHLSIKGLTILSKVIKDYSLTDSYISNDLRALFEADPHNLEEIIVQIPKLFDENTLIFLLKYPKILHTYSATLLGNLDLLKNEYNFSNEDIDFYHECLMVETKDLKERIENLINIFGISSRSRSLLSLIHLDITELSSLLQEMKENGFTSNDPLSVYNYLKLTIKKPKFYPGMIPSHLRGLNRELGISQDLITRTLHRHPHFCLTDNHKIRKVYHYLKSLDGITEEQILNGLNLCLYDIEKIMQALNTMKEREDFDEWAKHPYFLEALVYIIGKTYSFDDILIDDQDNHHPNIDDSKDLPSQAR